MNSNDLFEAIGEVSDEWIEDAQNYKKNSSETKKQCRFFSFGKYTIRIKPAIALCCVIVIGLTVAIYSGLERGGMGVEHCTKGDYTGHGPDDPYDTYYGPLFPISLLENLEFIKSERTINMDFSTYSNVDLYEKGMYVTEDYKLENTSSNDVNVKVVCPVVGYLADTYEWPSIKVNDSEQQYEIYIGDDEDCNRFRMYEYLFSNKRDWDFAVKEVEYYDPTVTVYELSGFLDHKDDYLAQHLLFNYRYDPQKSRILIWGFDDKGSYSDAGLNEFLGFYIKDAYTNADKKTKYVIVLGDDIDEWAITSNENQHWIADSKLKDKSASVTRHEMPLSDAVKMILEEELSVSKSVNPLSDQISVDEFYRVLMSEIDYFAQSNAVSYEYDNHIVWLDSMISEQMNNMRLFYLVFDVDIPSEGSVDLFIDQYKVESNSYVYYGQENDGVDGYELATTLGTSIDITNQKATISSYDDIEIVRQNYGFDLENGITEVVLDSKEKCYSIEVKGLLETIEEMEAGETEEKFHLNFTMFGFLPFFLYIFGFIAIIIILVKIMDRCIK